MAHYANGSLCQCTAACQNGSQCICMPEWLTMPMYSSVPEVSPLPPPYVFSLSYPFLFIPFPTCISVLPFSSLLPPQIIVITFQPSYVLPCFPLPLYPVLSISSLPSRHIKHPVSHSHLYPHKRVPQLYSNHWKCCHWLPLHLFFGQHNTVFQYLTK